MLHDGDVVLDAAFGLADVESATPMTTAHRFRIASHSKTFTATAVVRLAEHGVLRLDDPVGQWIDELADGAHRPRHAARAARPRQRRRPRRLGRRLLAAVPSVPGRRRAARRGDRRGDRARPQRALQVLQRRLLAARPRDRAGDRHAVRRARPDRPARTARAHGDDRRHRPGGGRRPRHRIQPRSPTPSTGCRSTTSRPVRWRRPRGSRPRPPTWCAGRRRTSSATHALLSDDGKRQMQRTEWSVEGAASSYGLGFSIAEPGGRRVLGHGGGFPGFITQTWFDPVDRFAVSVLTNAIDGPAEPLATAAVRIVDLALRPPDGHPPSDGRASVSAVDSPPCGGSPTSSTSAVACTCSSHPPSIRSPSRTTCASSTTGRC